MTHWQADQPWHPPDEAPDYTVLLVFETPHLDRFWMARHVTRGWELPGGRVEPEETLSGAARREWDEETGLPLEHLEPLMLHERPDGSRGHLFLGAVRLGPDAPAVPEHANDEKIVEVRAVDRLSAVAPLAFPDDPYARLGEEIWARAASAPWRRVAGEKEVHFVARLSRHPEAHPKGHRVVPHPAAGSPQG